MSRPLRIDVTAGELVDRMTRLELEAQREREPSRVARFRGELGRLERLRRETLERSVRREELASLTRELKRTNDLIGRLRAELASLEAELDFGPAFVERARGLLREDEARTRLKRRIDDLAAAAGQNEAGPADPGGVG